MEWVTDTQRRNKNSDGKIASMQREKDNYVNEYKTQRKIVDDLKNELQTSINQHTKLADIPNQNESTFQDSLAKIHKLRDQLKNGNERLKDLKRNLKDVQDKLKVKD